VVAATLAHNGIFIHEKVHGPMPLATKERIYRDSQIFGTALYSAKALLSGRGDDVLELLTDNFLN